MELINQLIIANDLSYINEEIFSTLKEKGSEISNKIIALRRNALNSIK